MTLEEALAENALLRDKISQLEALIASLQEQLRKNSQNSSKPPSSNPPSFQRAPKPPTGKKPGAQKGHKGHKRDLFPAAQVDAFVSQFPAQCEGCESPLVGEDPAPLRHQVVEIPPIKPLITEYQLHKLSCQVCGKETRASLPKGVSTSCFGPRLTAMIGLSVGRFRLSRRLVEELFQDFFGTKISLGSISNLEKVLTVALEKPVVAAREFAQKQAVGNADETGFRQKNVKSYLWVLVTHLVTVFQVWPNRNQAGAESLLGEIAERTIGSDRFSSYNYIANKNRQLCLEHLKRDFVGLSEKAGEVGVLGLHLASDVKQVLKIHREYKEGAHQEEHYQMKMESHKKSIHKSLLACAELDQKKASGMCREILKHEEAMWTFTKKPEVEPTNNGAERALRHAVIWRKLSFGSQSERGSRFVERMLSVVASLRQQKRNVLEWLTEAYQALLSKSTPPSLLPTL